MSGNCIRCDDSIITGSREMPGVPEWFEERLCVCCLTDFRRFMEEDPTDQRWATA